MRRLDHLIRHALIGCVVAATVAGCGGGSAPPTVKVGAGPGAESALLAHLYSAALRYYGSATVVEKLDDPFTGLDSATVRVIPAFTGRVLDRLDPDAPARSDAQVYRDMVSALPEGVAAGDYTMSAEDKPTLAVTEKTVDDWGGRDAATAMRNCAKLRPGVRAGATAPTVLGTCTVPAPREFADDDAMYAALQAGKVNAVWTSTAAPGIPSDVVVLSDTTALIQAENVVPLYRRNELSESQVLAVNEIAGVLDTGALADMLRQVAEGKDPAAVADEWLAAHPLGR